MSIVQILFWVLSVVALFSALMVITSKNPVYSVLWLIVTFFAISGHYILLNAQFLAIVNIIVYAGGVMVLFLFVVMMLDLNLDSIRQGFWRHFPLAATLGAVVALEMAAVLMSGFTLAQVPLPVAGEVQLPNSKALGILLYTEYLMPIQIAAAILLVAMFAAIALTLRERKDSKAIDASLQVRVRASDRLQLVQVQPTRAAPESGPDTAQENKA